MPRCNECGTAIAVHLYQLSLAGRPRGRYWLCASCRKVAGEWWLDLRQLPAWQERAALGDTSGARISGGHPA